MRTPAKMDAQDPIIMRLVPGPLDTTRHPSAIGQERASKCFNCSTERGIWERDRRYRRVQVPPFATITGEACTNLLAPDDVAGVARTGSNVSWTNPGNAIPPDGVYASATLEVGDKTDALVASEFASTGVPSGGTLTRLRVQVLARATAGVDELPVDVVDDLAQLTLDGNLVGVNGAMLTPLTSTATVREYEFDPVVAGITANMILAGRVGARIGYRTYPENASDFDGWTVAYSADGETSSDGVYTAWSPTGNSFSLAGDSDVSTTQIGTIEAIASKVGATVSYIVLSVVSEASGTADPDYDGLVTLNDGQGGTDSGSGPQSVTTTKTYRIAVVSASASKELALSAEAEHGENPFGLKTAAAVSMTASVVDPDPAVVEVDSIQLIACYETEVETTTTPQGIGIGRFAGEIDVAAVIGGGAFDIAAEDSQGAMGDDWRDERSGNQLDAGNWSIWPFAQWLFYAHPTGGVYRRTIGEDDWEPLYRDAQSPGSTGNAIATTVAPPYDEHQAFDPANDTPSDETALTTGGSGLSAVGWIDSETGIFHVRTNDWLTGPYGSNWIEFEVTLGTARDLSKAMALGFQIESRQTDWLTEGNDGFNDQAANNVVTLTNAAAESASVSTRCYGKLNQKYGTYFGWVDLTGVASTILDDVEKIKIRFGVYQTGRGNYRLAKLYASGAYFHDTDADALYTQSEANVGDLEYAYDYSEGSTLRRARKLVVPTKTHLGGTRAFTGTYPYLGSVQSIRVPVADAPYTSAATINLYRKVGDDYQRIATGPNDEDLVFEDRLSDSTIAGDTIAYPVTTMDFSDAPPSASGVATGVTCGVAWKGSNVYAGNDGKVYFSRTGEATEVLWENVVLTNDPGSEDLGPARTSTVADDTTSPVVALVAAENLYCFTRTEAYVFVSGDTAYTASFPRKIDGVRGVVGPRAACAYGDRALAGCDDGLWAIKKSTTYGEQPDELTEVTREVRGSWRTLLGGSPSTVVVRQLLGEVWAFNEDRYLHITREGSVIEGQWADERTVFDAVSDPEYGLILLMGDGHLGLIADCPTDGGSDAGGTDGAVFTWIFRGPRLDVASKPLSTNVRFFGGGGTVVATWDGQHGAVDVESARTGEQTLHAPFDRVVGGKSAGGTFGTMQIEGGPSDQIFAVEFEVAVRKVPLMEGRS